MSDVITATTYADLDKAFWSDQPKVVVVIPPETHIEVEEGKQLLMCKEDKTVVIIAQGEGSSITGQTRACDDGLVRVEGESAQVFILGPLTITNRGGYGAWVEGGGTLVAKDVDFVECGAVSPTHILTHTLRTLRTLPPSLHSTT